MSILILDKSICSICGKAIKTDDLIYSFPAFVLNTQDPLFVFNDDNFHRRCLKTIEAGQLAIRYAELFVNSMRPDNRISIISGKIITSQDAHIFIEYLTSDINSSLHKFNFVHIDKQELSKGWIENQNLINELSTLKNSNEWREANGQDYLGKLINELTFSSLR